MDVAEIEDRFAGLGPVTTRRMFGGKGVYHQGLIIAVEVKGDLLLKADAESAPLFDEAGSTQWAYEGRAGKKVLMPYWSIPDGALDDPEEMTRWARAAFEASGRAAAR